MSDTPIRHMLFLTVLLFVILSSGSLQCALNCYDRASQYASSPVQVADCHPLARTELVQTPLSNFCHHGHSTRGFDSEPSLLSIQGGQVLALSNPSPETPRYRSAEPFDQTFAALPLIAQAPREVLPLSQNLKQLRSTVLLM